MKQTSLFLTAICFCFIVTRSLLAAVPNTPNPTYFFDTGTGADRIDIGGYPLDTNVAASSTHICVTARAAFACYTKGGTLVSPGAGFGSGLFTALLTFDARPHTAEEFFTTHGISVGLGFDGSSTNTVKDGRIVFDRFRKRFFMVFQTREAQGRLLIAVSRSEDPRDGWLTYSDVVAEPQANTHDYQYLGVNATHMIVANRMVNCVTGNCSHVGYRNFMYPLADLVAGKQPVRTDWKDPKADWAATCVYNSYTTDAFWIRRDDNTHVSVWAFRNGKVTSQAVTIKELKPTINPLGPPITLVPGTTFPVPRLTTYKVASINYDRPANCEYRDGKIVWVSNEGYIWPGRSTVNSAVRLVRLDVSNYFGASPAVTIEIDRIYGRANPNDASGVIYDYYWPAVATNANGDTVVGSIRSNSTTLPELRANVWFAGQPDISPGVSLAVSSAAISDWHMAGFSADPSTNGVYLAQTYGASPQQRMRVTKMLGTVMPDVITTQVQPPATIDHGASGNVTVTVVNQGDGPMPASKGKLYLSTDNNIDLLGPDIQEDPSLGRPFSVTALAPNQVAIINVPFAIAATQAPGKYFVGAALYNNTTEYSKTNNVNPFQTGNHGNAPITVK